MFGIWHRTASYPSLEAISPNELRNLHAAWLQACGASKVPLAREMPVQHVQSLLPNMALIALGDRELDPRYLVFGPALRALLGRDPTGQRIRHVYPREIVEEIMVALDRVRRERRPLFFRRDFRILTREFGYTRLMLPLRDPNETISHVALGIYPIQPDLRHASQWQTAVEDLRKQPPGRTAMAAEWDTVLDRPDPSDPAQAPTADVWYV